MPCAPECNEWRVTQANSGGRTGEREGLRDSRKGSRREHRGKEGASASQGWRPGSKPRRCAQDRSRAVAYAGESLTNLAPADLMEHVSEPEVKGRLDTFQDSFCVCRSDRSHGSRLTHLPPPA